MDTNAQTDSVLENMETDEVLDATWEFVEMLCGVMSNPTPQAVPVYDWSPLENTIAEQYPVEDGSLTLDQLMEDQWADLFAPMMDMQQSFLQPGPVHSQTQVVNQPQTVTKHLEVRLYPIGLFEGKMIYGAPGDTVPPPVNACSPQKRKRVNQRGNDRPYVKKPPNAFMVYRNEQRLKVLAGLRNSDCAAVNTIIGQMWRALSKKGQEKYYEESARLRQIHNQLYPDWSSKDN
ncbi:protein pop-1-like [Paralichthys olivaceus]|uniref:protein pop-1-like n=1 Tax=Paralichthys olivaceus TaxID=8255 RepID=UPI003753A70F